MISSPAHKSENSVPMMFQNFENSDIQTGDFRLIDLFNEPFLFDKDKVTARVDDFPEGYSIEREMILVEKQFVPTQLPRFEPNTLKS